MVETEPEVVAAVEAMRPTRAKDAVLSMLLKPDGVDKEEKMQPIEEKAQQQPPVTDTDTTPETQI